MTSRTDEKFPDWREPLPLIECIDNKLVLNSKTAELIEEIEESMIIVTIAGPYRTGKSYLMNRLAGRCSGFTLGATIRSETKGIWAWKVRHPQDESKWLLIMDTEGLGDVKKGEDKYDICICCLSIFLSSVFVYNVIGAPQSSVIDKLAFTSDLLRHMSEKHMGVRAELHRFSPNFILSLRDQTHELVDEDGKRLTDNEYLEDILKSNAEQRQANEIREKLRTFFQNRKCFCFVKPVNADDQLKELENLSPGYLRDEFLSKCDEFRKEIHNNAPVKRIFSWEPLNGKGFIQLAEECLKAIDSGGVPHVETLETYMKIASNETNIDECLKLYEREFRKRRFPMSSTELFRHHSTCLSMANKQFDKLKYDDKDQVYLSRFQQNVGDSFMRFVEENQSESAKRCEREFEMLFHGNGDGIGLLTETDSLEVYKSEVGKLRDRYFERRDLGPMAESVWIQKIERYEQTALFGVFDKQTQFYKDQIKEFGKKMKDMNWKTNLAIAGGTILSVGAAGLFATPVIVGASLAGAAVAGTSVVGLTLTGASAVAKFAFSSSRGFFSRYLDKEKSIKQKDTIESKKQK